MTTRSLYISVLIATLLLPAMANAKVYVDHDRDVDFARYATYTWAEGTAAEDQLAERRIREAVDRELAKKGLERVDEGGDLMVVSHAAVHTKTRVDVDKFPPHYGYYWRRPFWVERTTVDVREIKMGTLIIDLLDANEERLVWRGKATGAVRPNPKKSTKLLNKAVFKMFEKYEAAR